jgi:hypothetical protein
MKIAPQIGIAAVAALLFSAVCFTQPLGERAKNMDFENAAGKNTIVMHSLNWKWGKEQKGWHIYSALLQKTLDTNAGAKTPEFAAAVADWQAKKGIPATGIINKKTLFSFIGYWQSKRLRPIYEAKDRDLETAPIRHFYDPTRSIELLKLDTIAFKAYKDMFEAAKNDGAAVEKGQFLKIVSSYRSPAYQKELRRRDPGANRAQIAFRSPHFTGRALDIYVGGEPVTTKDPNRELQVRTKAYKWLVLNADRFGFYPYFYEPWHWEYVGR